MFARTVPRVALAVKAIRTILSGCMLLWLLTADPSLAAPKTWNRAWTASLWQADESQIIRIESQTLRMQVRIGAGGNTIRLRFTNDFGQFPIAIGKVTVTSQAGKLAEATFSGKEAHRIPVGGLLVSDPVEIPVKAFELLTVSIYLPGKVDLDDLHVDRANRIQVSEQGDFTHQHDWVPQRSSEYRPLLAGIDVLGRRRPVIVTFGDSITDAPWCPNAEPMPCRWSEVLGRRLAMARRPHIVVNQGISGNRVLTKAGGHSAMARFDRDVLAIPGVTHLVILVGINDIGSFRQTKATTRDIIEGLSQLAFRAKENGIKVTALTLLPFKGSNYFDEDSEKLRQDVNAWIRSSRAFDSVVDIDRQMADSKDPLRLNGDFQSGDGLHPNGQGQRAIGEAIPLAYFAL